MTLPELARLSEAANVAFFDPFALHARLDFDFNDRESYPVSFPILIHEYTHYLQSVSTVYGLYRVLDWIRTGVRLVSVLPSLEEVRIPLLRWWTSRDCPEALRAQMADIAVRLALTVDLEQPVSLAGPVVETIGPLQIARVKFSDGEPHVMAVVPANGDMVIPIGARALAEGMSASVQRIWETEPRVDAVLAALDPEDAGWYTATRALLGEVLGSEEDLDFVNALVCDVAMMTRNPPAAFIAAVVAIIEAGAGSKDSVVVAVREALHEMVAEETAETRQDIAGILGRLGDSDEPFAQAVRRLLTACDELLVRRSEQIGFPLDVLFGHELAEVQLLLQLYPLPVYFEGTTFRSWHGEEVLERLGEELLMMEHVMRILLYGPQSGSACPLTDSSSCQATKSILCGAAPWRINLDAEGMTCAFGSALSTFGVLGKVIV
jgi:hypothetical protein